MKNKILGVVGIFAFMLSAGSLADQAETIAAITENVKSVCYIPAEAGKHWEMKIKGNGEAELKLKLAGQGVTSGAKFSKLEWQAIKTTVENDLDYRECVKLLVPKFLDKFSPVLESDKKENERAKNVRTLGGMQWIEFGVGVELTLNSCVRKSSSVSCVLSAKAIDSDAVFKIIGSSAIYDQNGKKYAADFGSIANFKNKLDGRYTNVRGELIWKVDTRTEIRFQNVGNDAETISKANIITSIEGRGASGSHVFEFRDIEIRL